MNRLAHFVLVAATLLGHSGLSQAQVAPICPNNTDVIIRPTHPYPPGGPKVLLSNDLLMVGVRHSELGSGEWDFEPQNFVITGNTITADAPGKFILHPSIPIFFATFGPLPGGSYSMVIQPIATNVTPNVPCPLLTTPFEVVQVYEYLPVPATHRVLTTLLAGALAMLGLFYLRRQYMRRRPISTSSS